MKKNLLLTIACIISSILLAVLLEFTFKTAKSNFDSSSCVKQMLKFQEENSDTIFSINNITYFSSCGADATTNSNSSFAISNLHQYTDIAIFINPNSDQLTQKNTLKSVSLNNISYILSPNDGTPSLYYKNINDFSKDTYSEENLINNSITFSTTSEDSIDYSSPILYNNCANPITLTYINKNIQDRYTLSNNIKNISHNGSLLKICGITLNSISCKIGFNIRITNNLDEVYDCPIIITIPLSTENSTIYNGNLALKDSTNYNFIKEIE